MKKNNFFIKLFGRFDFFYYLCIRIKKERNIIMKHRIIDSDFGEVMLKSNGCECDVYIGTDYDDYVGTIECGLNSSVDEINELLTNIL